MIYALSDDYKAKVRQYLGYFNLINRYSLVWNIPVVFSQQQILETNMEQFPSEFAMAIVTDLVDEIDCSREMIKAARKRFKVSEVPGAVVFNEYEVSMLWQEDYKLCEQLAQLLVTPLYYHPTGRGIKSTGGAWKVTTGSNVSAIGVGNFT